MELAGRASCATRALLAEGSPHLAVTARKPPTFTVISAKQEGQVAFFG